MEKKKVKIGKNEFEIQELNFLESLKLSSETDRTKSLIDLLKNCVISHEITEDFLKTLTPKEGNELLAEINKLNGWVRDSDFPQRSTETAETQDGE